MFIQPHDPDFMPEPIYPEYIPLEDEHILPAKERPLPPVVSPTAESPGYVAESDPEEDLEEYEDDETEDGPVDYPMDGGDDGDDDDGNSSGYNADDEDEDEEDEEEEEEHLAPADSVVVIPTDELGSVWLDARPSCITITSTTTILISTTTYNRRDDILDSKQPPRKRLCLSTLGSRYEVGESSTRGRGVDYGFADTVEAEMRHRGIREVGYGIRDTWIDPAEAVPEMAPTTLKEVNTRVTELVELYKHDTHDLYALMEDAQDGDSIDRGGGGLCCPRGLSSFDRVEPDRNEGVVGLTRWIEKMESVFNISSCAIENQVKFATCTLLDAALTWWNGQIRTLGPEAYAMTWEVLKNKMTNKYCPQGEVKKLEIELWNLKVKGNDVPTYTNRFQELTLICTKFVANENEKIDKYISGLPDSIYGNVRSSKPRTLDETIELTNDLMDQKLRNYAKRADNKRKADDTSRSNHGHQQQPFKKQNVAKVYNMGTGERKPYEGSFSKCTKCQRHHNGPCTQKCNKCNKVGHFARDCRSSSNANVANAQRDIGNAEKNENAPMNPNSNVVTSTFLLNNRYASILFDTGADRSFISTAFSSLIFLAQISVKKEEDKSEGKQLKDVPIVRDFPKVFHEDLPGLPPARPVEFQIDLIPGAAPVARAPYRLAPFEMKELSEQLQELSDKGFIRPRIKFDWGEKEENAFQLIKQKLCSAPILALPGGSEDFVVYCDASHKGLGVVLMQREKVIAYASRQLKIHEKN
nr:hypothetical protein [Tanacetum cinerariifolium]